MSTSSGIKGIERPHNRRVRLMRSSQTFLLYVDFSLATRGLTLLRSSLYLLIHL